MSVLLEYLQYYYRLHTCPFCVECFEYSQLIVHLESVPEYRKLQTAI